MSCKPGGNCSCNTRPSDGTDEGPSQEDIDAFSDVTRPCPNCKAALYDDVVVCWKCGYALNDTTKSGPPVWIVVVAIVLLATIVVFWIR